MNSNHDSHSHTGDIHPHDHAHSEEIHLHDHKHGEVTHKHAHYHPQVQHQHAHDNQDSGHQPAHDGRDTGHQHTHTYPFEIYAYASSPIHDLDARIKIAAFIALILTMVVVPISETWRFALFAAIIACLYVISGVPLAFGLKRSLIVIPFVTFAGALLVFMPDRPHPDSYDLGIARFAIAHGGLYLFINALVKSWLSTLTIVLLYSTTPFPKFVKGLELLRVPRIITMLLSFLYRFIWILTTEVKRMIRARDARSFGGSRVWRMQIMGQMIGSLFIRSYERAERIYSAMSARGYDGTIKTLDAFSLTWRDAVFSFFFFSALFTILIWRL